MEATGYTTLTRQVGLLNEMSMVANNIANAATTGFRQEGLLFSEYVVATREGNSLSMATANVPQVSLAQGALTKTGGRFDFAIEGLGFFMVDAPDGQRLTRAGSFSPNAEGELVTPQGYRVLDAGAAPIFIPPDAHDLTAAADGTLSAAGAPLAQIGLFQPIDPTDLQRRDSASFATEGALEPVINGKILQGFVENSNVDPITQLARMIEVQRAYEMGQSFLDAEDERIRAALQTFLKS